MLKFLIIVIAAIAFGYFAYINFDKAFGEDIAYSVHSSNSLS